MMSKSLSDEDIEPNKHDECQNVKKIDLLRRRAKIMDERANYAAKKSQKVCELGIRLANFRSSIATASDNSDRKSTFTACSSSSIKDGEHDSTSNRNSRVETSVVHPSSSGEDPRRVKKGKGHKSNNQESFDQQECVESTRRSNKSTRRGRSRNAPRKSRSAGSDMMSSSRFQLSEDKQPKSRASQMCSTGGNNLDNSNEQCKSEAEGHQTQHCMESTPRISNRTLQSSTKRSSSKEAPTLQLRHSVVPLDLLCTTSKSVRSRRKTSPVAPSNSNLRQGRTSVRRKPIVARDGRERSKSRSVSRDRRISSSSCTTNNKNKETDENNKLLRCRSMSRHRNPSRSRSGERTLRKSKSFRLISSGVQQDNNRRSLQKTNSARSLNSERGRKSPACEMDEEGISTEDDNDKKENREKRVSVLRSNSREGKGERRTLQKSKSFKLSSERSSRNLRRSKSAKPLRSERVRTRNQKNEETTKQDLCEESPLSCPTTCRSNEIDRPNLTNGVSEDKENVSSLKLNVADKAEKEPHVNRNQQQANSKSSDNVSIIKGREHQTRPSINRRNQMYRGSQSSRSLYKADMRQKMLKTSSSSDLLKELRMRDDNDVFLENSEITSDDTNIVKVSPLASDITAAGKGKSAANEVQLIENEDKAEQCCSTSNDNEIQEEKKRAEECLNRIVESSKELKLLSDAGQLDLFTKMFMNLDEQDRKSMISTLKGHDEGRNNEQVEQGQEEEQKQELDKTNEHVKKKIGNIMSTNMVLKSMSTLQSKQKERKSKKEKLLGRIERASINGY